MHIVEKEWFAFPIKLVEYISKQKINAIYGEPSGLVMTANMRALGKYDISCLKKVMFCGEVMPIKQLNMWRKELPNTLFVNYYGPGETTYASTYYIIDREFRNDESLPIGKAVGNTNFLLIRDGKKIEEINRQGEIYIRGSGLELGYYDINGNFMYDGRMDYQIKHMGFRIELGEIETCIAALEQIGCAACIFDEEKDRLICYFTGEINEDVLWETVREKLPEYMMPQRMIHLQEFPMSSKLDCIEEEFNIEVDGADIVPENFETVEKIVQLVRKSEK